MQIAGLSHFIKYIFLTGKWFCFSFSFSEHSNGGNSYMGTTHSDASQGKFSVAVNNLCITQDTGSFGKQ